MRRVAITGMGIVSSLGNNAQEVSTALAEGKSGISAMPQFAEMGFRSQVAGQPSLNVEEAVDKRVRRFMGDGAAWNYVAMEQAIADAGLEQDTVQNPMTGLIMGSGGPSTKALIAAADTARNASPKRVGPFAVPKAMSSTNSATLPHRSALKGLIIPSPRLAPPHRIASAMRRK